MLNIKKKEIFSQLLSCYDIDLTNANFEDTPKRLVKSWDEILEAQLTDKDEVVKSILDKTFPAKFDEMIVFKNIIAWGVCPHHFLPLRFNINFAYFPDNDVIGLSKIPRVIQYLAKQPILQEQYTTDVLHYIGKYLKPKGMMVRVEGEHLCMQMRGVKTDSTVVITNALSGTFKESAGLKQEFLVEIKS